MRITQAIDAYQFVSKYQLISKQLRFKIIADLEERLDQIEKLGVNEEYDYIDFFYQDILEDIYDLLYKYEDFGETYEDENWLYLNLELCNIYDEEHFAFTDLLNCIFRNADVINFSMTQADYYKFCHKKVLRQITDEVAYRPGNIGFENTRDHFYALCMNY
jgi:hypothetical protein